MITADLLYVLAKMGHGDYLIIADANFPSDSVANSCIVSSPIRITGVSTTTLLGYILTLMPLDQYVERPLGVMDRVPSDKERDLHVPTYTNAAVVAGLPVEGLDYIERFEFYAKAKNAFAVVQTDDSSLYANLLVVKGVI